MICEVSGRLTRQVDGTQVGVPGELQWRPTMRLVEIGYVQLPEPQTVIVDNEGYFSISVESTEVTWCWEVKEDVPSGIIRYVVVPATLTADYGPLQDLDKSTLTPTLSAVPSWVAATTLVQAYSEDAVDARDAAVDAQVLTELARVDAELSKNAAAESAALAAQQATETVEFEIGTVTTGPAAATLSGVAPLFTLDLVVPQGEQGVPGVPLGVSTYLQEAEPVGPAVWFQTDALGRVIDVRTVDA